MSIRIDIRQADVVVLGLGHCGGPVAAELSVAGYKVVGLERGPFGITRRLGYGKQV